ncbi:MAG: glycoside hydrolase family protein [Alphaproteobacteria bacterium]|nr:glycoside hydrolase family protein [Alphaproteobacteria bacterium]
MQTPKFLQELLSSPEYGDKNSDTYKRATKYMNILYPGTVQFDATGHMTRPEYDMTLAQFDSAQGEIDADFETEKDEASDEVMDEYGDYFENIGFDFNIEEYVIPGDPIPVNVLMPGGNVSKLQLDTYELDIPEFKIAPKIWRWHSENGENTCDECAGLDKQVFFSPDEIPDVPAHPNCQCSITEETLDEKGKTIAKKDYKAENRTDTKKVTDMKMSDKGIEWLKDKEYKVLDKYGNHVVYDDATGKPVNPNETLPKGATIGYGHLVKPDEDFKNGITEQQAVALLRSDIAVAERTVQNNITANLTQNQYDALVSLAYNIGASGFKNSTVVEYINNPNFHSSIYSDLESAWKAWNQTQGKVSNGLINRRQNEWNLYAAGIY